MPRDAEVELAIFDVSGRKIATVVSQRMAAGSYEYVWDAGDQASGVYLYQLRTDAFVSTKKLVLLR